MKGKALIDLPEHKLKCGEIGEIADAQAKPLVAQGYFDPKAVEQAEAPVQTKTGTQTKAATQTKPKATDE